MGDIISNTEANTRAGYLNEFDSMLSQDVYSLSFADREQITMNELQWLHTPYVFEYAIENIETSAAKSLQLDSGISQHDIHKFNNLMRLFLISTSWPEKQREPAKNVIITYFNLIQPRHQDLGLYALWNFAKHENNIEQPASQFLLKLNKETEQYQFSDEQKLRIEHIGSFLQRSKYKANDFELMKDEAGIDKELFIPVYDRIVEQQKKEKISKSITFFLSA